MKDKSDQISELIRIRLSKLNPDILDIKDESKYHIDHHDNKRNAKHYYIDIISSHFSNLSFVEQHRLIYHQLDDLIPFPIHALRLNTKASIKK